MCFSSAALVPWPNIVSKALNVPCLFVVFKKPHLEKPVCYEIFVWEGLLLLPQFAFCKWVKIIIYISESILGLQHFFIPA